MVRGQNPAKELSILSPPLSRLSCVSRSITRTFLLVLVVLLIEMVS